MHERLYRNALRYYRVLTQPVWKLPEGVARVEAILRASLDERGDVALCTGAFFEYMLAGDSPWYKPDDGRADEFIGVAKCCALGAFALAMGPQDGRALAKWSHGWDGTDCYMDSLGLDTDDAHRITIGFDNGADEWANEYRLLGGRLAVAYGVGK